MRFKYLIIIALLILAVPVYAFELNPNINYELQGQAIINYTNNQIGLENGTTILLDNYNLTQYLNQIVETQAINRAPTFYTNSQKYNIVLNATNASAYNPTASVRIQQGDCVVLGETIDISGDGWYTGQISYYGPFYGGYSDDVDANVVATYNIDSQNLTAVYIDPAFFIKYPGWWYMYYPGENGYGNTTSGYDRLFYLGQTCQKPNATVAQMNVFNATVLNQMRAANLSEIPVKTESTVNFIVSKNDTTTLPVVNQSHIWLFGTTRGVYDIPTSPDNTTIFWGDHTINDEPGLYNMFEIQPDKINNYEVMYDRVHQTITSPFKSIHDISVVGMQPFTVESLLQDKINQSPDTNYTVAVIDLQDPDIQIMKLDQWKGIDNTTLFEIAGYTNANAGDTIHIFYDENRTTEWMHVKHEWDVTAWGNQSAYRQWNLTFSINLQNEAPIMHSFTVTNDFGAVASIPFYVYHELPQDYQDQVYLNYIGNSPFIPTPTPEIITNTVKVVVTVPVPVNVPVPVDYRTLSLNIVLTAIPYVIVGLILFFTIKYLLSCALIVVKEHRIKEQERMDE